MTHQQVVERAAQRVDIRANVDSADTGTLLGGHVVERPHSLPGERQVRARDCTLNRESLIRAHRQISLKTGQPQIQDLYGSLH